MADTIDWGAAQNQLKQKAGANYDDSMFGDLQRNASNGTGPGGPTQAGVDDWVNRIANKSQLKATNAPNSTYEANGQGGTTTSPTGQVNRPANPYSVNGGAGSGGGAGGGAQMGAAATPFTGSNLAGSGQYDQLYSLLMGRAGQSLHIDPNDPVIANQVNAYAADSTRAGRNYVDQLAESSGPNANLSAEGRMMAEKTAQGAGGLRATLMGNELTARRTEIQNALAQMGGMLSGEQAMALQKELGLIDANLRQQGINSGNDQFAADYGLRATDQANHWDWLRSNGGNG